MPRPTTAERFWSKVDKAGECCGVNTPYDVSFDTTVSMVVAGRMAHPLVCERCGQPEDLRFSYPSPERARRHSGPVMRIVDRSAYPLMTRRASPRWPDKITICQPCLDHYEAMERIRAEQRALSRAMQGPWLPFPGEYHETWCCSGCGTIVRTTRHAALPSDWCQSELPADMLWTAWIRQRKYPFCHVFNEDGLLWALWCSEPCYARTTLAFRAWYHETTPEHLASRVSLGLVHLAGQEAP